VARAQEYIAAGDIYQVNLAQKFSTRFAGNPYRLFEHLLARSPAPGGAFLDFGDTRVLSASPELFLRIRGRHITTRPIKGTRPRSRDPVRDEQLAFELLTDPKELAELVMITDLERNDLGQICEYGSVTVTQLVQLERFPQVFHLVSTIEGLLRPGIDALDAVRACLPGGSISGAPKKPRLRDHRRTGAVSARDLYRADRLLRRQRRRGLQHRHPDDGAGGRESPFLRRQRDHGGFGSGARVRGDAA
jgi:para-aminobenzoate synthetase component 1